MEEIEVSKLIKMGAKPIGGALITFYTNEMKDSLFLEGSLEDSSQLPNLAVLRKVTQALKGELLEEEAKIFLKQLLKNKKANCTKILISKAPKHGKGKSFIKEHSSDFVKSGEIIGRVSAPEQGEDGYNLYGQLIPAATSKETNFSFDNTVFLKDDILIANRDGKVIYDEIHNTLTVDLPYQLEISSDKMEALFTYIDKEPLTRELLMKILVDNKVVHGILEDKINEYIQQHNADRKPLRQAIVAKGTPMIETKHGRVILSFEQAQPDTNKSSKEATEKMDYKNVNKIICVQKGERIALIRRAVKGKDGIDIFGAQVHPAEPREMTVRPMKNIRANEAMTEFFAEKDGAPIYKHGLLSIADIMQIQGNLTLATGNIDFEGSVSIEGDVGDDYTIKAEGDILIGGSVGSSKLIAGGRILIGQGFNGRGTGRAECIGDFKVKFMKEVTVTCEGNVTVEAEALNCNINALGQLLMEKSNLIGGEAIVLAGIFVNDIGSSLGVKTRICPGVSYLYASRKTSLEKHLDEIKQKTIDINTAVGPILKDKTKLAYLAPDKRQRVMDMVATLKTLKQDADYTQEELTKLIEDNKANRVNDVITYNRVYPGSIFKIGSSQKEFKVELTGPILITEDLETRTIRTGPIKLRNKPAT